MLLPLLLRLCRRCGQLYVVPDSGARAVVLDESLDAEVVAALYAEACEYEDAWEWFFEEMYGPEGLSPAEGDL